MNALKSILRNFGYEIKKHYKIDTPTAKSCLINVIHHYHVDLVIDAGANTGQFGKELRNNGYTGEIHSFEPVKATFQLLKESSENDLNWHVHHAALGAEKGEFEINVMDASDLCSFSTPSEFGKDRLKGFGSRGSEMVKVNTLDWFLAEKDLTKRRMLLKMDTQGHDLEVMKGSIQSLGSIWALQSEISFKPLYNEMPSHLESLRKFDEYGYSVAGMYPVGKSEDLSVIEMDCIFVRKSV